MNTPDKRPAFITGGSSGIGLALARQLAERGHPVAIFARRPNKLQAAAEAIGPNVRAYPCDVANRASVEASVSQAIEELGAPGYAIANAGVAEPGEFLEQRIDAHEYQMQINYFGALYFARACAVAMPEGANLVFVGSGSAFFGIYGYGAYAPSKFAVRGLAEVLRVELAPRGISVTLAYPPDTETPMLETEERLKPEATKLITASGGLWSPEDVARVILKRTDKGRFAVTPGWQMTALLWLHSLLAPGLRRWQAGIVRKTRK
ncbi:SDR family oxidoreductase [Pseudoruegeria sp. HB172150]|uniref:SDR family oxidoreductase n=1 Tax=Pseudoruegeria sp. HB172150 TaxID=2721164 RepID=UPI001551DD36|nr:SDR family oxidoreductase [Pseudoruegeria sp. HB172150]